MHFELLRAMCNLWFRWLCEQNFHKRKADLVIIQSCRDKRHLKMAVQLIHLDMADNHTQIWPWKWV